MTDDQDTRPFEAWIQEYFPDDALRLLETAGRHHRRKHTPALDERDARRALERFVL